MAIYLGKKSVQPACFRNTGNAKCFLHYEGRRYLLTSSDQFIMKQHDALYCVLIMRGGIHTEIAV